MPTPRDHCAETHYGPIDADHRDVVQHIHALDDLLDKKKLGELRAAMAALVGKVVAHFAHEERLMAECRYNQTAEHKEAHANFLKDVKRFDAELRAKGLTEAFRLWAGGRLGNWFRLHIRTHDIALAKTLLQAESTHDRANSR